jgi:hypothetical protein
VFANSGSDGGNWRRNTALAILNPAKELLLRQTHAFEQVGIAGIGTQRIESGNSLDAPDAAALFPASLFQQAKCTIFSPRMA